MPYYPQSPIHLDSLAILSLCSIKDLAHPVVPKILNKEEQEDGMEKEAERERRGRRRRRKRRGKRGRRKTKRGTRKKRRRLQSRSRK